MELPDLKELGVALAEWRARQGIKLEDLAGRAGVTVRTVKNWESGSGLSYKKIRDRILGIYGLRNFDHLLDEVSGAKFNSSMVRVVEKDRLMKGGDRLTGEEERKGKKPDYLILYPSLDELGDHRIRVDQVELLSGGTTGWGRHLAHEYVLITEGEVSLYYSDEEDGDRECKILGVGDAAVFHSKIFHEVLNHTKCLSKYVVARPAWAPAHTEELSRSGKMTRSSVERTVSRGKQSQAKAEKERK